MKNDLALSYYLCCHPKISLKSLHHFIFHELSYQTSSVFPFKFHGYHVCTRDCEFVFAMRLALLSGCLFSRRGPDPSLCGRDERPTSLKRIYCELIHRFDTGLIRHDPLEESEQAIVPCVDGSFHFIHGVSCRICSNIWTFYELLSKICQFIQ